MWLAFWLFTLAGAIVLLVITKKMGYKTFWNGCISWLLVLASTGFVRWYGLVHEMSYTANIAVALCAFAGGGGGNIFIVAVVNDFLIENIYGWQPASDNPLYPSVSRQPLLITTFGHFNSPCIPRSCFACEANQPAAMH